MAAGKNFKVVSTLAGPFPRGEVISEEHIKAANHDVEHWKSIGAIEPTDEPVDAAKVAERVGAVAAVGSGQTEASGQIQRLDEIIDRLDRIGPMLGRVIELLAPPKIEPLQPVELKPDTGVQDRLDRVVELLGELVSKSSADAEPAADKKAAPADKPPKGK